MSFNFTCAPRTIFGEGALETAAPYIADFGKKALIVTGKIITKTGLAAKVQDVLSVRGISSVIFNDLPGEPDDKMIDAALSVFKVAIHFLMNSTLGKGISAVKYDEISAEIMSVDTNRMKLIAFTFSSFLQELQGDFLHIFLAL